VRWTVVIPAKALPQAKSRLLPASADADAHRQLVRAIRSDTASAARAADGVARVLVVTDRPSDTEATDWPLASVLVQTSSGLNEALREAAEHAAANWPDDGVAALVGDLPALRPDDLAAALGQAAGHPRAHVPDAAGTGTTLLTATPGAELAPEFGDGSAARHAAGGAPALTAAPGLRADVDTADDLLAATRIGVGPATAAVIAQAAVHPTFNRKRDDGAMTDPRIETRR
jgi:2-phospho-L-lactate guanylyltransferase